MTDDTLRYDKLVELALRGVVRDVLAQVARTGLPGAHHFYVTFRTKLPGVQLSPAILARHPDEMTIVLQHQFWDLEVTEDFFSVTLSFSGVSERLVIPFVAVVGFADPSVQFGLQFEIEDLGEDEDEDLEEAPAEPEAQAEPSRDVPPEGAKVIALDAFRKK